MTEDLVITVLRQSINERQSPPGLIYLAASPGFQVGESDIPFHSSINSKYERP